jgi:outer membrane lipoprotein-sorting protein
MARQGLVVVVVVCHLTLLWHHLNAFSLLCLCLLVAVLVTSFFFLCFSPKSHITDIKALVEHSSDYNTNRTQAITQAHERQRSSQPKGCCVGDQ